MRKIRIFKLCNWGIISMEIILGLVSCTTNRGTVNAWEDAGLAARQRFEIEQLQQDIVSLRTQLGDAQQLTQSSVESIDRAYAKLESSLSRSTELQTTIDILAEFARQCLTEINRLRKYQSENTGTQPTDRGEDAGERY